MLLLRLHVCASVFQKTNNHDLLSLRVYNDALDAWEVDTYDEDEDEMDSLMHHMEHELFSEFLRLVLFASPVLLACLHAYSSSTQDTTPPSDRLSKLKFSAANTSGTALGQIFPTPPFSGLPFFLLRSNRALRISPGGVLSCVVYGTPTGQALRGKLLHHRSPFNLHHMLSCLVLALCFPVCCDALVWCDGMTCCDGMGWDGITRASRRARQPPGDDQLPEAGGAGSGDASRDPRGTCVYKCVHAFVCVYQVLSDRLGSFVARLIRQSADRALRVTTIHVWASKIP